MFTPVCLASLLWMGALPSPKAQEPIVDTRAPAEMLRRFYEVNELFRDFVGRSSGTADSPTGSTTAEERETLRRVRAARDFESLCGAFLPEPKGPGFVLELTNSGTLVASMTLSQHQWLERFLVALSKQPRHQQILVETHILMVPTGQCEALGLGDTPSVLVDAASEQAFLEKAKATNQIDMLSAPRVSIWNGERATISTLEQTAYIKRFDVIDIVEPGRQRLIDPVIDVVEHGLVWEMRGVLLPEGTIGMESILAISELVRPMEERKTEHGVVGVPEVKTTRVQSTVQVKAGQTFVLSAHPSDGKRLVLLLKATPIEAGDLEQAGKEPAAEPSVRKR
ncbi:MAG: hypothetical protein JNM84_12595 [Planctomycetes bacterium]|nr:hypothetical protein [Planctomycetota bacterium]